tara:strand:- start:4023 stop:6110 length:2088 start_codon:yes stop_codon:yes gene_type:complete
MQKLQLYIGTERVDLFKDETVSFTQTIQNVKDISKIFTEFSKTFSLPASKVNNKIFKHYYNFNIEYTDDSTSAFDARNKVAGYIELNTIPFKEGYIKLEGVDLKKNTPHTYRITFFGNTINLSDVLGDDQLSTLSKLSDETLDYTYNNIYSKLTNDPTGNICTPLITHTQRLRYSTSVLEAGNLYWNSSTGTTNANGVLWTDLKFAIRLQFIIDAIEAQANYGITFSNDFFNNTSNTAFYNLWMWLHRKKGSVEPTSQLNENFTQVTDLAVISGNIGVISVTPNGLLTLNSLNPGVNYVQTELKFTPTSGTNNNPYSVKVFRNGAIESELSNVTGTKTMFATSSTILGQGTYSIEIASITGITFNAAGIKWTISIAATGQGGGGGTEIIGNAAPVSNSTTIQFAIQQQIPEMTVIDFLTAIFKMFNLTAYVDNTGTIVVRTLDSYYAAGSNTPIPIDQYLDVTKSSVDIALPFKEILFAYKGLGTFLAKQYNQVNNISWGTLKYTNNNAFDAPVSTYKVEIPFEHIMNERLYIEGTTTPTTIQYGYFVDDNQEPYYGLPLVFYAIRIVNGTDIPIKQSAGSNAKINDYIIPSNSKELTASASTTNINFAAEVNEYSPSDNFTGTLFNNYYSTYITQVFNPKRRLIKVNAFLPLKIYQNLQLNDKFQINQQDYKINSITTNLTNGKSQIELLNVIE